MKKIFFFFFLFFITFSVSALELPIESKNAILYNLDENKILYEKNSEEEISIASLTKIMTAVITLENASLDQEVTITYEDFKGLYEVGASTAGFKYQDKVTVKDLLYGLLLPSGAEAAQALTRLIGKEKFYTLMNEKAESLGLSHTHFVNETGLDEEGHYSSVKDVAILFTYALQNETFKSIIESKSYTTTNGLTFYSTIERSKTRYNLDMDYLIGGKTGTTNQAGLCLASIAKESDVNYMLVTCGAPNDWSTPRHLMDAKTIYDYFISHYENQNIVEEGEKIYEIPTKYAEEEFIPVYAKETITKYLEKESSLESFNVTYDEKEEVTPFTKPDTCIGTIHISFLGEEVSTFDVYMQNKISLKKEYILFGALIILLIIFLIVLLFVRKKKNKKKRK